MPRPVKRIAVRDAPPIDPIAALEPSATASWIVPGRIQLELGATMYEAPGGTKPLQVSMIERQGQHLRIAVRLAHARFSLWTDRSALMSVLESEQRVSPFAGPLAGGLTNEMHATLRAGARVTRLANKNKWTQVRYVGAIQVEGWVPDEALGERGPASPLTRRRYARRPVRGVIPGAVIRAEPRFGSRELALMVQSFVLETVREIDSNWVEVSYSDGDVRLHGVVSKREPPGRIDRPKDPERPLPEVTTNAQVASGTCLYSRPDGEPIGYIVGDRDVALDRVDARWWVLMTDSPWGPLAFAARGPSRDTLTACAPPGSVPAPAPPKP